MKQRVKYDAEFQLLLYDIFIKLREADMNIIYATDNFPPPYSGHAKAVINMSTAMRKKGHSILIIAPSPTGFKNYSGDLSKVTQNTDTEAKSIEVYYLKSIHFFHGDNVLKSILINSAHIRQIISDFNPDIIHYNGWGPLCKKVYKAQINFNNIETIATCHGVPMHVTAKIVRQNIITKKLEKIIWKLMVQFYNKLKIVISPSDYVNSKLLAAGLAEDKGIVISNGIETNKYVKYKGSKKKEIRKRYKLQSAKILITYIGRLEPEKNIHILIKTMKYFQHNKSIFFVIAGSGKLKGKLQSICNKNKYNVNLLHWLNHEELINILGVSDIFFNPSPSESQSITTLEAMASYLPIVAADEGALPDLVKDNVNGYSFKNNDFKSCTNKLSFLANNPLLVKEFGNKSRENAYLHDRKLVMNMLEKKYISLIKHI